MSIPPRRKIAHKPLNVVAHNAARFRVALYCGFVKRLMIAIRDEIAQQPDWINCLTFAFYYQAGPIGLASHRTQTTKNVAVKPERLGGYCPSRLGNPLVVINININV
ncbi:MAG: hypothetical protein CM15mP120_21150 [Pseudomonadota bacterium]|nr:MAG: hypothetical protein CM15mP120_21150 [Pseudomonadota bacterium]